MTDISRPGRDDPQGILFDVPEDWRETWWGMPDFNMKDTTPAYRVTINFLTEKDLRDFSELTQTKLTTNTDSRWFPYTGRDWKPGTYYYDGPQHKTRYPLCIPSKGRYDVQTTGKLLDRFGCDYKFFVEETEGDLYKQHLGEEHVVVMPFHDLGQGSVPARNFIWDWAREREHRRHWVLDDNILAFVRMNNNRRLRVKGGRYFNAMEDFVDRYENIVMAGPHDQGFAPDRSDRISPFLFNSRVYSCILLDTYQPHRWRGRYNEDTDLSLRFLKDGFCTVLFRALLMDKAATVGVRNSKAMKGGNTDNVYNTGDSRRAFADSLREQHPDVVETVWKFERWHHKVDYTPFASNKPILKPNVVPTAGVDNYEMTLTEKT